MSSGDLADERDDSTTGTAGHDELAARIEVLQAENERLREEYRRARTAQYRETTLGLAGLSLVAVVGTLLFPESRDVLLAFSGTGLFAAVLVWSLTPERFIAASVGERIYDAHAATGTQLVGDLGLTDKRVYVPADGGVRLFVPQHTTYDVPPADALDDALVITETDRQRGLAVEPTGAGLFREFERDVADEPAREPDVLGAQLADALVDGFELVDEADPDSADGRLSVAVTGSAYGAIDAFDHPVVSFCAVGVASQLDDAVTVEVGQETDDRADAVITCRWNK